MISTFFQVAAVVLKCFTIVIGFVLIPSKFSRVMRNNETKCDGCLIFHVPENESFMSSDPAVMQTGFGIMARQSLKLSHLTYERRFLTP